MGNKEVASGKDNVTPGGCDWDGVLATVGQYGEGMVLPLGPGEQREGLVRPQKKRASKGYSPPIEGRGQDQSRKRFEVCERLRARMGPN